MAFPWRAEEVEIVGYECHWAFDDGQHIRIAVVYVLEFLIMREEGLHQFVAFRNEFHKVNNRFVFFLMDEHNQISHLGKVGHVWQEFTPTLVGIAFLP